MAPILQNHGGIPADSEDHTDSLPGVWTAGLTARWLVAGLLRWVATDVPGLQVA